MKNYINIKGKRIKLTDDQVRQIAEAYKDSKRPLASFAESSIVKIGEHEMVVLEQLGDEAVLIRKDLLGDSPEFGKNNNYAGSLVDAACEAFEDDIADVVGGSNICTLTVDLTSDDGLKDYGSVVRRAALLTAEQYRKYVKILDEHKVGRWWWLATPYSTPTHDHSSWVKCAAPSGSILDGDCRGSSGVRPFCILKSNIFVSE